MTPGNNVKNTKMSRQRLGPSSPLGRSIHFGEGLAETGQARQRLGASCDLLSAYQYVLYEVQLTTMTSKALHSRSRYPLAFPFFEVIFKRLSVLLPNSVHEVLQICKALDFGPQIEAIMNSAECLKAVPVRHTPDDGVRAIPADLHEDVENELRGCVRVCISGGSSAKRISRGCSFAFSKCPAMATLKRPAHERRFSCHSGYSDSLPWNNGGFPRTRVSISPGPA